MNLSEQLAADVLSAYKSHQGINLIGAGTKSFLGHTHSDAQALDVTGHNGIIEYDPAELVLVARAGTPLKDIVSVLSANQQMLGFEPPFVERNATLGGAVASGLSGPARAYRGAVRDYILGATFINGKGQRVVAGGKVIKNVAGFDLFRPMAGAMGTLGLLLDISLRVIPMPETEVSLRIEENDEQRALKNINQWAEKSQSISASSWDGQHIYLRLSGTTESIEPTVAMTGGEPLDNNDYWQALTDFKLDFFQQKGRLWRVSLAPMTRPLGRNIRQLIDWGGAQRWLKTSATPKEVRARAEKLGGQAECYSPEEGLPTYHPMSSNLLTANKLVKKALDPRGIFNPRRFYSQL